jgi:hypothetical protein
VNSTLEALADCLIAYRALVTATVSVGGDDAFLDGRVPKHLIERFAASVSASDPAAAQPGHSGAERFRGLLLNCPNVGFPSVDAPLNASGICKVWQVVGCCHLSGL